MLDFGVDAVADVNTEHGNARLQAFLNNRSPERFGIRASLTFARELPWTGRNDFRPKGSLPGLLGNPVG